MDFHTVRSLAPASISAKTVMTTRESRLHWAGSLHRVGRWIYTRNTRTAPGLLTEEHGKGSLPGNQSVQTGGLMYTHQDREDDPPLELASIFAHGPINTRFGWIGRIDRLIHPSPRGDGISYLPFDPSAPATMYLAGLEFDANDHFRLTPNIVYTRYDRNEDGVRPESDLHIRLTLFANFE